MKLTDITASVERRRAIVYGSDDTPVRHWYEVRQITGPYYMGNIKEDRWGTCYDLFLFLPEVDVGLIVKPYNDIEQRDVEWYEEAAKHEGVTDKDSYIAKLRRDMDENCFIGSAQIEFVKQWDVKQAEILLHYRVDWKRRRQEAEQRRRAEKEAAEAARKAEEDARKAAEDKMERAKYLGWADKMTALRFGKVHSHLDSLIRSEGEIMTRRDFVITRVREGWKPDKEEGATHWYGKGWAIKESKPRTEYELRLPDKNMSYTVSKTEYDFALYLMEKEVV